MLLSRLVLDDPLLGGSRWLWGPSDAFKPDVPLRDVSALKVKSYLRDDRLPRPDPPPLQGPECLLLILAMALEDL